MISARAQLIKDKIPLKWDKTDTHNLPDEVYGCRSYYCLYQQYKNIRLQKLQDELDIIAGNNFIKLTSTYDFRLKDGKLEPVAKEISIDG